MARAWGPPFYGDESAYFVEPESQQEKRRARSEAPRRQGAVLPAARARGRRAREPARGCRQETRPRLRARARAAAGHHLLLHLRLRPGRSVSRPGGARPRGAGRERNDEHHRRAWRAAASALGVSIADITAGMYAAFGILTAVHARADDGPRSVHRCVDARRTARHPVRHDRRLPGGRYRARPLGTAYARAAAVSDVPDKDPRYRHRHRQRQAVARLLPVARRSRTWPTIRATSRTPRATRTGPRLSPRCRTRF